MTVCTFPAPAMQRKTGPRCRRCRRVRKLFDLGRCRPCLIAWIEQGLEPLRCRECGGRATASRAGAGPRWWMCWGSCRAFGYVAPDGRRTIEGRLVAKRLAVVAP